ncbi:MAG TPA: hypothetical protein DEB40_13100 [Elusimicrobia bacterium]|nr:hypothetical protein [Elusimicrobiota bacterium]HBT62672.1 hypothetical protein [Elusimicrobiota bacterium]
MNEEISVKTAILAFCMTLAPSVLPAQQARVISLAEAYRLSLAKSETLAQDAEGIKELEAAERLIRSAFLPALTGLGTESSADRSQGKGQAGLNLNYELFSGMRDYISARASALKTEAARLGLARAKQALYLNVAQACINLSSVRQELAVRQGQLGVSTNRIKELQGRESVGRSRKSEVVAAQAQLAQDESALQNALGREKIAQLELGFLTGLEADLAPEPLPLPENYALGPYLRLAQTRFDVEAARMTLEAARLGADAERHLRWPSLNVGANYYFKRPAPYRNVDWDAGLTLSLPLFSGGAIGAAVDQAQARGAAAEYALALAARRAATEVNEAFSTLEHSLATLDSLKKALVLAEDNARMQSRDYTYSLVTNLDVLNAQNALLQTKLGLEQARAQACWAGVRLEVAGGGPEHGAEAK